MPRCWPKTPTAAGVASSSGSTWAITDGNQRRAISFGQIDNAYSYLLGPGQRPGGWSPGVPLDYQVVSGKNTQTVAAPIGASSVSATSYGSTPLYDEPSEGPDSAFDGDPTTAWVATAADNSVNQSLSITFDHAIPLSTIHITPLDISAIGPRITRVTLTTDAGAVQRDLPVRNGPIEVSVARGGTVTSPLRSAQFGPQSTPPSSVRSEQQLPMCPSRASPSIRRCSCRLMMWPRSPERLTTPSWSMSVHR